MNRRVLVISNNCFSKSTNNGKTLESLFNKLKIDNISQLYFTDNFEPDFDFCNNYFRISDSDVAKKIIWKRNISGGIVLKEPSIKPNRNKSNVSTTFLPTIINRSLLRFCRDLLWSTNSWKTENLINWCKKQKPEYIFFVGGGTKFTHDISTFLSDTFSIPLITFFTDDYLICPRKKNLFDLLQHNRINRFYQKTIKKSSLCFTIGEKMCDAYSQYFGKTFYPIMNSVNVCPYSPKIQNKNEITLNYFGTIHTNRWKTLLNFALFIRNSSLENREKIRINVYTVHPLNRNISKLFSKFDINYKGGKFGEELKSAMSEADILLHVESEDKYSKSLTKLSVSTKIPEYLMTGRPILGIGPEDVASMQLLTENNIGVVISLKDKPKIIFEKLNKIINEKDYREVIGKLGYEYAINHFNNNEITNSFYLKIEQIFQN